MKWEGHPSRMLVAAHRGERFTAPENTSPRFSAPSTRAWT